MDRELGKIGLSAKTVTLGGSGVANRSEIEKHSQVDMTSSHMGEAMGKALKDQEDSKPKDEA